MEHPACRKNSCVHWEEGYCALKDPEQEDSYCLHYEDRLYSIKELATIATQ